MQFSLSQTQTVCAFNIQCTFTPANVTEKMTVFVDGRMKLLLNELHKYIVGGNQSKTKFN